MNKRQKLHAMIILIAGLCAMIIIFCVYFFTDFFNVMQPAPSIDTSAYKVQKEDIQFVTPDMDLPPVTEEPAEEPVQQEANIVFTGDVMLDYGAPAAYDAQGITGILSDDMLNELSSADVLMINNEFPFSERGDKWPDKQYNFRVNPKYVSILTDMGVDIATLANNHALDYGRDALMDSIDTLNSANIATSGAGASLEEAKALKTFTVGEKTFGFLSACRVIPTGSWNITDAQPGLFCTYDTSILKKEITAAKETCDYVFVYVHWGIERNEYPEDYQRSMAREFIAAGADAVIGSHPHVLQGIEYFDGKPVFYSLGNFIFNTSIPKTAAIKITVAADNTLSYKILPATAVNLKTSLCQGEDAQSIYNYLTSISYGVTIDENGYVHN